MVSETEDGSRPILNDKEQRRLLRRTDWRLLPVLMVTYLLAFLDRGNIANALTLGLIEDLHLTGAHPNVAVCMFFVTYILFDIPSNILMKRLRPRIWLSTCIFCFGVASVAQGLVTNYAGLLATRLLLGFFEAGLLPGCNYLISFWYKREESQLRYAIFQGSVRMSSVVGNLLASGLTQMDGVAGLSSWRWIFIIEGLITVAFGSICFFIMCEFPDKATWLEEKEYQFVKQKTGRDDASVIAEPDRDKTPTATDVICFLKSPEHHVSALIYTSMLQIRMPSALSNIHSIGCLVPGYGLGYFVPTMIKNMGFGPLQI